MRKILAYARVSGDAPRDGDFPVAEFTGKLHRTRNKAFAHGTGERGAERRRSYLLALLLGVVYEVDDRGLETRKAHVVGVTLDMGAGQNILGVVTGPGKRVDVLAARVGQAEDARCLIKALAGRVVPRRAHDTHVGIGAYIDEQGIPARDRKTEEGRLKRRKSDVVLPRCAP